MIYTLLEQTKFEDVWNRVLEINEQASEAVFRSIWTELLSINMKENKENWIIHLRYCEGEFNEMGSFDLAAYREDDSTGYCFSFIDWDEVLASNYELNGYDQLTFLATFLSELTFYGSQLEMVKVRDRILVAIEGFEKGVHNKLKENYS